MRRTMPVGLGAVVLGLLFGEAPAAAKDQNKSIEEYQAKAMASAGSGGRSSLVEINISGWTT